MSAITLAQNTIGDSPPGNPKGFLKAMDDLGFLAKPIDQILAHEDLAEFFKTKKSSKKKSTPPPEERRGQYDGHRCDARIWKEKPRSGGLGYDNIQCSSKKIDGCNGLCKKHFKLQQANGLWTGLITEPRPEEPVHPTAGPKMWCTDTDGNEVVKEKKKKKSSPKKTKKEKVTEKDWSEEELMALLSKKKKEKEQADSQGEEGGKGAGVFPEKDGGETEDMSDGEEEYETINVDGVEYQLNKEDKTVIRVDDFSPVGKWNTETSSIDFDEEDDE